MRLCWLVWYSGEFPQKVRKGMAKFEDYAKRKDAGSTRKEQKDVADEAEFRGFLNVNLTDAQKSTFDKWCEGTGAWETLHGMVGNGVVVSVKTDARGGGFIASATQRRADSPNAGLCVTARAGEPPKALLRLLFTLAILGHSDRWEDVQPIASPDRW